LSRRFVCNLYNIKIYKDLYINWNNFAPENWKTSTVRMLVKRAYLICTQEYLYYLYY